MKNFWILNPDAELELAGLAAGNTGDYTTSAAARTTMNQRRALFDELTLGEPALLAHELAPLMRESEDVSAFVLWCPTPSLISQCRRCRVRVPPSPPVSLLISVNDKTRLKEWGLPVIPERRLIRREEDMKALQKNHETLRIKRPFGFAGRGQRRLTGSLSADDTRWLSAGLRGSALVAEPELSGFHLKSVHFLVHQTGNLMGRPLGFVCDDFGAFQSWETRDTNGSEDHLLRNCAAHTAERLLSAGYFGPAAIDFAVCETGEIYALDLNGRFSLGWSRGMGELRDRALLLYRDQES